MENKIQFKRKLLIRDFAIAVLFIVQIIMGFIFYTTYQGNVITHDSASQSWLRQQTAIGNLQECINKDIRPCEIYEVKYN